MKKSGFTESQIMSVLKQADAGRSVVELCRAHAISNASFYKWRAKYSGMDATMIAETKAVLEVNRRLKKMFAELSMQNELLKEAIEKKQGHLTADGWPRKLWRRTGRALHLLVEPLV
jgi:putative transposase